MLNANSLLVSFLLLSFFITSCNGQDLSKSSTPKETSNTSKDFSILPDFTSDPMAQIGDYIVDIYEDKKGNMWFGTLEKGVARYDGKKLIYMTTEDGLVGNGVVSITEDTAGNMWFGTHSGLSKYDGKTVTNFTTEDGLCHHRISNLLIDNHGTMWIGTWGGVCQFDGTTFTDFPLPNPEVDTPSFVATKDWVTEIMEDKAGNIWIGRSGYGACKYDGTSFINFTKKEGLLSNCVQEIEEDNQGNIWIACRIAERDHPNAEKRTGAGGLSRYDGKKFTHFPDVKGLSESDVYEIYKDKKGNIWVSTIKHGAYQFDGEKFTNYQLRKDIASSNPNLSFGPVQSILEDTKGKVWFGCSGGLFRLEGEGVINVTKGGPWK